MSPGCSCVNVHSQQHVLVMCATAFYLIENYPLDVGPEFSASIIQVRSRGPFLWNRSVCALCPAGGTVRGAGTGNRDLTRKSSLCSDVWGDAVRD